MVRGSEPNKLGAPVVGVLGAGQLGRMLAVAGLRLGIEVRFLTPHDSGATRGIGTTVVAAVDDRAALEQFVADCSVVTIENEWAPLADVAAIAERLGVPCHPSPAALAQIADKLIQKQRLVASGCAVGPFAGCANVAEAEAAAHEFGYPVVLKRRRGAYDGYGNRTARDVEQLRAGWAELAEHDGLLVEAWAPFVRELAVMVARRADGEAVVYPVVHTIQENHICAAVVVPAPISTDVEARAQAVACAAVEAFEIVGVCAVELFELADGRLWVNELAPRPHNSGHFSIEACVSSQYDNHLRAILGLPLGDPSLRVPAAVMVNLLGPAELGTRPPGTPASPDIRDALAIAGVDVHLYGKRDPRPGRKLGHITVTGEQPDELRTRADRAAAAIRW